MHELMTNDQECVVRPCADLSRSAAPSRLGNSVDCWVDETSLATWFTTSAGGTLLSATNNNIDEESAHGFKPPCPKVSWVPCRGASGDHLAPKHLGGSSWRWSPRPVGCTAGSCAGRPPGGTSRRTAFGNVTPWSSECAGWDS